MSWYKTYLGHSALIDEWRIDLPDGWNAIVVHEGNEFKFRVTHYVEHSLRHMRGGSQKTRGEAMKSCERFYSKVTGISSDGLAS